MGHRPPLMGVPAKHARYICWLYSYDQIKEGYAWDEGHSSWSVIKPTTAASLSKALG